MAPPCPSLPSGDRCPVVTGRPGSPQLGWLLSAPLVPHPPAGCGGFLGGALGEAFQEGKSGHWQARGARNGRSTTFTPGVSKPSPPSRGGKQQSGGEGAGKQGWQELGACRLRPVLHRHAWPAWMNACTRGFVLQNHWFLQNSVKQKQPHPAHVWVDILRFTFTAVGLSVSLLTHASQRFFAAAPYSWFG